MLVNFKMTVEDIVAKHHAFLRKELPRITDLLSLLVEKLPDNESLKEAQQIFKKVRSKIETHLKDEETVLFPTGIAIEIGDNVPYTEMDLRARLEEMEKEHDNCGNALGLVSQMVSTTGQNHGQHDVLDALRLVQEDLNVHVEKENTQVHPRFLELLDTVAVSTSQTING